MQTASLLFFPLSRTVSPLNSCSSSIFACKQQNVRTSFWKNRNTSIWRRVIWLWKLHLGSDILNPEDRDFHYSGVELNLTLEEGHKLKWILQTWDSKKHFIKEECQETRQTSLRSNSCSFWCKHLYSCCKVTFQVNRQQQLANYQIKCFASTDDAPGTVTQHCCLHWWLHQQLTDWACSSASE